MLAYIGGLAGWLCDQNVLLKQFKSFSMELTESLKDCVSTIADNSSQQIRYLASSTLSQEDLVRELLRREQIEEGLVCILSCVEPCQSYHLHRNRETKHIAQKFLNKQPWENWSGILNRLLARCCPLLLKLPLSDRYHQYYWSADETEFATDVMFRTPQALDRIYPQLLHQAMATFSSRDVMRFLGRTRLPARGGVDVRFNGQVVSDLRERPEGTRIKHRLNQNSVKMYNKQGSVLRVETTINDAHDLSVYRTSESDPDGPKKWQRLRKGVVDLPRRAAISRGANKRYLDALAGTDSSTALGKLADTLAQPVTAAGRRYRGLNPMTGPDAKLAGIVLRGEFTLKGFRNRDIRKHFATTGTLNGQDRQRLANKIGRLLRLFREHKLILKHKGTHRYQLTAKGRRLLPAFIAARNANSQQLHSLAA